MFLALFILKLRITSNCMMQKIKPKDKKEKQFLTSKWLIAGKSKLYVN